MVNTSAMLEFWLAVHYIAVLLKVAFLNDNLDKQARSLTLPPQPKQPEVPPVEEEEPQVEEVIIQVQQQQQASFASASPKRNSTQNQNTFRYTFRGYSEECLFIRKSKRFKYKKKPSRKTTSASRPRGNPCKHGKGHG